MGGHRYAFGAFVLDLDRGALLRDGAAVPIGSKAMALLGALVGAEHRSVAKADLLEVAWPGLAVEESNLSVQVAALRKLLGPHPAGGEWIATVPRVGYRFVPDAPASARTTVLVKTFANLGGTPEDDALAAGITEDIVTTLTRFRWFSVVRHGTGAHYQLTGGVRRPGQQVRVTAQLVDAATGAHLWAEKYDTGMTELLALQDEIAARVAGAIEPELLRSDASLAAGGRSARDRVREGTKLFHQVTRATHHEARALFREACRLDPAASEAHTWLARVSGGLLAYGWTDDPAATAAEGIQAGLTAVRLDEQDPYAHYGLAIVSIYGGNLPQGVRAAERAVELNASFALGHLVLGMALLFSGEAGEATAPLERGLELSPHDPQNFAWLNFLALARLFSGQHLPALDAAHRLLQARPDWRPGLETLLYCEAAMDRWDDARRTWQQLQAMSPPPGDTLAPLRSNNPAWASAMTAALSAAAARAPASG